MGLQVKILRRKLTSAPLKQVLAYSVMQDAVYRSKFNTDPIGAACSNGNCAKCVFYRCEHPCHQNQVFIDPMTLEGSWKELKRFAWVPKELNAIGEVLNP